MGPSSIGSARASGGRSLRPVARDLTALLIACSAALGACAHTPPRTPEQPPPLPPVTPQPPPTPPPEAQPPSAEPPSPPTLPSPKRLEGTASWYGPGFDGRKTASGEPFDENALTGAHRTLALGTRVRVTNLENGRSVVVRINDRPGPADAVVIDLSRAAGQAIGLIRPGTAQVRLELLGPDETR